MSTSWTRTYTVSRNRLSFEVFEAGATAGDAVLCLHGFPQHADTWSAVAGRLAQAGYRVVAINQRGYSPKARPAGRRQYIMGELVADVVAVLDNLKIDSVHLLGHDLGAGVAWATAMWHPGRVRSLISLSIPHPAAFILSLLSSRQLVNSWYVYLAQLPQIPELLYGPSTEHGLKRTRNFLVHSGLDSQSASDYVDRLHQTGAFTAALNWYRAMPLVPPWAYFRLISVPTLLVWGANDAFMAKRAIDLTAQFVAGPYVCEILSRGSHWLPEEMPEEIATLAASHLTMSL